MGEIKITTEQAATEAFTHTAATEFTDETAEDLNKVFYRIRQILNE